MDAYKQHIMSRGSMIVAGMPFKPLLLTLTQIMNPNNLPISHDLQIPLAEIQFRFARSSGPGGQHVNRAETQVELLWDVAGSPSLTPDQRQLLLAAMANRIDKNGILHLVSGHTRSQERNRQEVMARFVRLLQEALRPPRPRRPTRPPAAARKLRLRLKKHRSQIKRRRRIESED